MSQDFKKGNWQGQPQQEQPKAIVMTDEDKRIESSLMELEVQSERGVLKLTPSIVRKYIATGGNVTDAEIAHFLVLCRYQHLNPFLREAYLVKFGTSPASIIIGKETYVKRARRSRDFRGWRAGLVYWDGEKKTFGYTEGAICPPGYGVAGGWAEVYVEGLKFPVRVEASLEEYQKTTKDGVLNSMWSGKKNTMIRKVALVQALREAFPEELEGMLTAEEVSIDPDSLPVGPVDDNVIDIAAVLPKAIESTASEESAAPAVNPANNAPAQRRRSNRFTGLPTDKFAGGEIKTCGVTPTDLLTIRSYAQDKAMRGLVEQFMKSKTGYDSLSYLREDEAAKLIKILTEASKSAEKPETDDKPPFDVPAEETVAPVDAPAQEPLAEDVPEEMIACPVNGGDKMKKSYCMTNCIERQRDGWCPILGEEAPAQKGLF